MEQCFLETSYTEIGAVELLLYTAETWQHVFSSPPMHRPVCLVLYLHYWLQKLPQNVQACTTLRLDFFCSPWWEFILIRIYLDFNSLWEGMYYLFSIKNARGTNWLPILQSFHHFFFLRQSHGACFRTYFCRKEGIWDIPLWTVVA